MKNPVIDPKTHLPVFELDEQDIQDAFALRFWIDNQPCPHCKNKLPDSRSVLRKYLQAGRDSIIADGMRGTLDTTKKELSAIKWAILKGFVDACGVPDRIVNQVETMLEQQKKIQEEANDGNEE